MATEQLSDDALVNFCDGLAVMLGAGFTLEEAADLVAQDSSDAPLARAAGVVYGRLAEGASLAEALEAAGAFPEYMVSMVRVGRRTGHMEAVLRNLAAHYAEESRIAARVRSSVGYPAALLVVMTVVVAFTVAVVLPLFVQVYEDLGGSITAGSFGQVRVAMFVGWVALGVSAACSAFALYVLLSSRGPGGQERLARLLARIPGTRRAMAELAFSRFVRCLALCVSAGLSSEDSLAEAVATADDRSLEDKARQALALMSDVDKPRPLIAALAEVGLVEPGYARILSVGSRSGSLDQSLGDLATVLFDEATQGLDDSLDAVEPVFAALSTATVGATLVAVMFPLISIMGSMA